MEREDYDKLQRGDGLVITFGRHGTQYAMVHHRTPLGRVWVTKWRARSRSWTKPRPIMPYEIIRRAKLGEYQVDPWPEDLR